MMHEVHCCSVVAHGLTFSDFLVCSNVSRSAINGEEVDPSKTAVSNCRLKSPRSFKPFTKDSSVAMQFLMPASY